MGGPLTVTLTARDDGGMRRRLERLCATVTRAPSDRSLRALAAESTRNSVDSEPVRAAVVATGARDVLAAAAAIDGWLAEPGGPALRVRPGAVLVLRRRRWRIGLLFPGQGVPLPPDAGTLTASVPEAAGIYARARLPRAPAPVPPAAVQLAIVAASLAGLHAVRRLGIVPAFALGHSLGELAALHWSGAFGEELLLDLARERGRAMAAGAAARGGMASVLADPGVVEQAGAGLDLTIACFNAPANTVVSGERSAIEALLERLGELDVVAVRLDVTGAFHSPLMRDAAAAFGVFLGRQRLRPPRRPVISSVTGTWLARDRDICAHLVEQIVAPVRFREAVAVAGRAADLLVEVGPGRTLSRLVAASEQVPVVSTRAGEQGGRGMAETAAVAWACGGGRR